MWLTSFLIAAVVAAPPKVASTRFSGVDISDERAEFYTEHFADRLADHGPRVVTQREIATLLGMERQRALMGCSEETSSCLVELANALGVDAVVLGTVAKVGTEFQLNLKIIASSDGRRLAASSAKVSSESALLDALTNAAASMATELTHELSPPRAAPGPRVWWWLPAGIGALALAGGTVGLVIAENSRARLASEQLPAATAVQLLESGRTARTLGWIGLGVGLLAAGTTAGLLFFGGSSSSVTPVAAVSGDGASFGVVGVFP